ncbi:MAG: sulfotransferase [Rikenellaceae bacterium]
MEFSKLPVNTLVGSDWKSYRAVVKGRLVEPKYRTKYRLTTFLCWVINLLRPIENLKYRCKVKKMTIDKDPLFVLGHWRSGTTYVHNVLTCDNSFGYTTTYQTVFPNVMLSMKWLFKSVMGKVMPKNRPQDNMELSPDLPQEEEFALSGMMPYTYYNFWFFPKDMAEYCDRFLMMNMSAEEKAVFAEQFRKMVKLSMNDTGGERYLSKNPPHTARVKEILEIFPNAKFIYLMRNPYTVFESTRGFFTKTLKSLQLHDISDEELTAGFVDVYAKMYDKYQREKGLIPEGNLIEVKFEDFEADAVGMTKKIYDELSLGDFERVRPAVESYVGVKRGHKKNRYDYAADVVETVNSRWGDALSDWGYEVLK